MFDLAVGRLTLVKCVCYTHDVLICTSETSCYRLQLSIVCDTARQQRTTTEATSPRHPTLAGAPSTVIHGSGRPHHSSLISRPQQQHVGSQCYSQPQPTPILPLRRLVRVRAVHPQKEHIGAHATPKSGSGKPTSGQGTNRPSSPRRRPPKNLPSFGSTVCSKLRTDVAPLLCKLQ